MKQSIIMETEDFNVGEDAFWHLNMDLYYGFQVGEVVEVAHESNKYWLATIEYSFKRLILLKWVGGYGEFWIDISASTAVSSSNVFNEFGTPKRFFPLGYHMHPQLKSHYILERPTTALIKPTLYNPTNDPYADIKTVDDLLSHEINSQEIDAFGFNQTASKEPQSIVMAKCKTKIAYGQEDVDELEAALQNLNEIESDPSTVESSDSANLAKPKDAANNDKEVEVKTNEVLSELQSNPSKGTELIKSPSASADQTELRSKNSIDDTNTQIESFIDHEAGLEICKKLIDSVLSRGYYFGIGSNSDKVFYEKPKQFFEGGANYEKVLVPGTLLEFRHLVDLGGGEGSKLSYWPVTVIENNGGRLTLRWYMAEEPKFKQGRLELKTAKSQFISDQGDQDNSDEATSDAESGSETKTKLSVKDITFCAHYCCPMVASFNQRDFSCYNMPSKIFNFIAGRLGEPKGTEYKNEMISTLLLDTRRTQLDKDRPMIHHLFSTVRWKVPKYVDIAYAPKDKTSRREVLLSTPKTTKLLRGHVVRELDVGVFEIHSEPISDEGEMVKFLYPLDNSYSILPVSWAASHSDCPLVNTSRTATPTLLEEATKSSDLNQKQATKDDSGNGSDIKLETSNVVHKESLMQNHETLEASCIKKEGFYKLMCEIPKLGEVEDAKILAGELDVLESFDEFNPHCWSRLYRAREHHLTQFKCILNCSMMDSVVSKFKVMDELEVVHPSSDTTICLGRIRKVAYPLLWIQISPDSYTLLPFNSTDIYPKGWCESNNQRLVSLLPFRKKVNQHAASTEKKKKKIKTCDDKCDSNEHQAIYEKEEFDLEALNDKQTNICQILNEKNMYIKIYFNHKCFTGPSLSKGKICSLPQYVGPGPMRLVMEEVVTKVISVAYVPPRILNELSSKSFEELLIARNMTNTAPMQFKAKYQKRVHRESIPVCLNPSDVTLYCECVCEHLKCCYNLFGPNLYDGDDCPGHCRALTKSNKFMKRATYYREKARLGEFTNSDTSGTKKTASSSAKSSRARYAGRDSSESTSSGLSRSDMVNSRASSAGDDIPSANDLKENLVVIKEQDNAEDAKLGDSNNLNNQLIDENNPKEVEDNDLVADSEMDNILLPTEQEQNTNNILAQKSVKLGGESEFTMFENQDINPEDWSVDEVAKYLEWCRLGMFKLHMVSEGVDGQALLLLDKIAIREHFQTKNRFHYTQEELGKLCRFVEFVKSRAQVGV